MDKKMLAVKGHIVDTGYEVEKPTPGFKKVVKFTETSDSHFASSAIDFRSGSNVQAI